MQNVRELKEKLDPAMPVRVVRHSQSMVGGGLETVEVMSDELVPGDVLDLEQGIGTTVRQLSAESGVSGMSAVSGVTETAAASEENRKTDKKQKKKKNKLVEWKIPCDAVLLSGSCIVNESILTGEKLYFENFMRKYY